MRVVVVGAEGAVGDSLLADLASDKLITTVVSLVEHARAPSRPAIDLEEHVVDLSSDLTEHFRFADAVVYAGWPITRIGDEGARHRHLVTMRRTAEGVAAANVQAAVFGSSVTAYAPKVDDVDAEQMLADFERDHPAVRVVRLRPGWVVQPRAHGSRLASTLARKLITALVIGRRRRVVPDLRGAQIPIVHVADLALAYRLALTGSVTGSFDLATDPLTTDVLAQAFNARPVPLPRRQTLKFLGFLRRLGLESPSPEQLDLSLQAKPVDTREAEEVLGWRPRHSALSIVEEWAASLGTTAKGRPTPAPQEQPDPRSPAEPVPPSLERRRAGYEEALDYFGSLVHQISDDQWGWATEHEGWSVLQVVLTVAREQYRLGTILRGERLEGVEPHVPTDPLGFDRASGWNLAAERGRLALASCDPASLSAKEAADCDRALAAASCQIGLLGWYLGRAIGGESQAGPELQALLREELTPLNVS